jgi:hypothetical protein
MSSILFALILISFPGRAASPPAPAPAGEEEEDFFSSGGSTKDKGANAGVPDGDAFNDDESYEIPVTQTDEEKAAEAKLQAALKAEREAAAAAPAAGLPAVTAGVKPLADNWAPSVSVSDKYAVVIDMPVLYALTKKDFDGANYWLVAEVYADGKKVAEGRTNVTREAIADKGPSVQFFRLFTPVSGASGVLEVKVSRAPTSGKSELLFTRSVKYQTSAS